MEPYPQVFTPRESWPPGTVIKDDYVIESRVGKGGFGTVYKAKHRFLQSDHVIKRLHEEYSSDEEYVRKFIAEGQVIRRLKECPYIVAVEHMTLTADQYLILIMEYMPGGDLNKLMQERRFFTIAEVAGYTVQIAEGLRAAHAIDLIHRDVKPHNVLLAENKRKAKLTDFGIAADHQSSQATSVVRGGSLGYAAPEQWTTAGRNLDGRTDIYALGVTMYQMLTQCMPYAAGDIGAWIEAVRTTQPIHANKLREDIPDDLNRLVMQMIEVRREHRPPNIETVLECLRPYADAADWSRSSTMRVPDRIVSHDPVQLPASTPVAVSHAQPMDRLPTYTPTEMQPHYPPPPAYFPPQQPPQGLPVYQQQQTPPQWNPPIQQPPPPPLKKSGGAGKWLLIVPVLVALAGGGGWYGWKMTHPDPTTTDGDVKITPGKDVTGGGTPIEPAVDWIKKGEEARDRHDYHEAVKCFRQQPSGMARIQGIQTLVEADVDAKVAKLSDMGHFDQADALLDEWLADFPLSDRLKAQKELIARRRAAQ